jgi:hypothetical protein
MVSESSMSALCRGRNEKRRFHGVPHQLVSGVEAALTVQSSSGAAP